MRKLIGPLLAVLLGLSVVGGAVATASPSDDHVDSYFGDGNLPPGCVRDMSLDNPDNKCFHMRTGLNALDSPQIDVLVLAPASPTVERDMRLMRQVAQMWEGGIDGLAAEMDMPWLRDVDFHITVDALDGEFTTYPLIDPEIVLIASNPIGGVGIGVDPVALASQLEILDENAVPCTTIENPFDLEAWEALPGFDSHHDGRTGTYVEDCGGAGGNVCFAINGAIDPVPGTTEVFSLFDLVSHEMGHCLTLGHVGDGAEGSWGPVPTNDIMSYNEDPPGISKCVSSLDVEGFALRMSRYLDRNDDGRVDTKDRLIANDRPGDGMNPFQVQSPTDHVYASSTGRPQDCPQPDVGIVPGAPVDWSPTPVSTSRPVVSLTAPRAGASTRQRSVTVAGRVHYVPRGKQPRRANASVADAAGDSRSPFNDIQRLSVDVTNTSVNARLSVAQLWPTTSATSLAAYSVIVNGRRFDSFVPTDGTEVATWDASTETYVPGFSRWDEATSTVIFRIPRRYLERFRNVAPYWVGSSVSVQNGKRQVFVDDTAPEGQRRIGVTGRRLPALGSGGGASAPRGTRPYTVTFSDDGGNELGPTNTNLGTSVVADNRVFSMSVTSPSKVELTLGWSDPVSDLDLTAQAGAGDVVYGDGGTPEKIVLDRVRDRSTSRCCPPSSARPAPPTRSRRR